jgi:hypothetical protein
VEKIPPGVDFRDAQLSTIDTPSNADTGEANANVTDFDLSYPSGLETLTENVIFDFTEGDVTLSIPLGLDMTYVELTGPDIEGFVTEDNVAFFMWGVLLWITLGTAVLEVTDATNDLLKLMVSSLENAL